MATAPLSREARDAALADARTLAELRSGRRRDEAYAGFVDDLRAAAPAIE